MFRIFLKLKKIFCAFCSYFVNSVKKSSRLCVRLTFLLLGCDVEGAVFGFEGDLGVVADGAGEEFAGDGGFEFALEIAFEGAGAEDGIVAFFGDEFASGFGEFEGNIALAETVAEKFELDVYDLFNFGKRKWFEENNVIHAV